jgi:adenine-specific DNA-methyltransferase
MLTPCAPPETAQPDGEEDCGALGEVFTRRWIVELILDLVGYTADKDLAYLRLVEPSCGEGSFLAAITARVSASCRSRGRSIVDAVGAVCALDLQERNVRRSRALVEQLLRGDGWSDDQARWVAVNWIKAGDYLLDGVHGREVDFVVGNPPYVRLEDVPEERMGAYRRACSTMSGRADVYVGFYEKALESLRSGGRLGFICADRWMRNQYGRKLRMLIAQGFSMDLALTMHDVDAFHDQVSAYPAITVISRRRQGRVVAANATGSFGESQAAVFASWFRDESSEAFETRSLRAARLPHWFSGDGSWPLASPARLAILEDLDDRCRPLEDDLTGTRVGIGVATGADKIFITSNAELVEQDRLLPLSMVRDTTDGALRWHGSFLVNPWESDGSLVDLAEYPLLAAYLRRHADELRRRYVATRQPERWYKTIDKVDANLTGMPKLLFPDMKMSIHPVHDNGGYYPHHNLYYVVSDTWDLRVLGGLLLSKVAEAFVDAYAVKMRGGTLRFQAQYLRKIRVPRMDTISDEDQALLAKAFDGRDVGMATEVALRAYGLTRLPD